MKIATTKLYGDLSSMHDESFWTLLRDPAHWEFELFLIFIFDVVIGVLVWPRLRKAKHHHRSDDRQIAELQDQVRELQERLGMLDDK